MAPPSLEAIIAGMAGTIVGSLMTFAGIFVKQNFDRNENERRRKHEIHLQRLKEDHDKDMQRRGENIKRTGFASHRELGG